MYSSPRRPAPAPQSRCTPALRPLTPSQTRRIERTAERIAGKPRLVFEALADAARRSVSPEIVVLMAERLADIPAASLRAASGDRLPPRPLYLIGADGEPVPVRGRR